MVVDILFSVLNFAVLAGIFAYIFFRTFVPQLSAKIAAEKQTRQDLAVQHTQCAERLAVVETERERREELYRSIARKVAAWKLVVDEREKLRSIEQQERAASVRARAEKQAAAFIAQRRWAQVVPQAMAKARLELYNHFQQEETGSCYIDQIMTAIKRERKEKPGDR